MDTIYVSSGAQISDWASVAQAVSAVVIMVLTRMLYKVTKRYADLTNGLLNANIESVSLIKQQNRPKIEFSFDADRNTNGFGNNYLSIKNIGDKPISDFRVMLRCEGFELFDKDIPGAINPDNSLSEEFKIDLNKTEKLDFKKTKVIYTCKYNGVEYSGDESPEFPSPPQMFFRG